MSSLPTVPLALLDVLPVAPDTAGAVLDVPPVTVPLLPLPVVLPVSPVAALLGEVLVLLAAVDPPPTLVFCSSSVSLLLIWASCCLICSRSALADVPTTVWVVVEAGVELSADVVGAGAAEVEGAAGWTILASLSEHAANVVQSASAPAPKKLLRVVITVLRKLDVIGAVATGHDVDAGNLYAAPCHNPEKEHRMHIWVDADACPAVIKEILYRAAERVQIPMTLVANKGLRVPASRFISTLQVLHGFDVADNEILNRIEVGDLVITGDIPLASAVIDRGAHALDPRGDLYTTDNICERLQMRNFMDGLRAGGVQTTGPAALDQADRKRFADQLDRLLSRRS